MASIEQKSLALQRIPFSSAINLAENVRYIKYLGLPALIILLLWLSGSISSFFGSYERVVNYDLAYDPPAPFTFRVLNDSLIVLDNQELIIRATTVGDLQPENMFININDETLLMRKEQGIFQHTFEAPVEDATFSLSANDYESRIYRMVSLTTPVLKEFSMHLQYPSYTLRKPETLKGTGNALVPEGTRITWKVTGSNIDRLHWRTNDTVLLFEKSERLFELERRLYQKTPYSIFSSNENVE
ncbi:MAG: hypothetical protein F6K65_39195, partial [Moorea sp. SIO3C2]|nr:hypothetical protein [Moorena sp. SIO3C2]